jgi:glycosyltransferase involved in cell wall biosynthesis
VTTDTAYAEQPALETEGTLPRLAVVIPCYRVRPYIISVLREIGPEVSWIYCVEDGCPERTSLSIKQQAADDPRIRLIKHVRNRGVGGAYITGCRQAIEDGADIIVKLDGDGQMDPNKIPELIQPLVRGEADYVKGNRFFDPESVRSMPWIRVLGNVGLSFFSKLSSGYWNLFDTTNGFTAIHASVLRLLPLDKISSRYFFESDMLFRLNTVRAVIADVPMDACYSNERSSLNLFKTLIQFPLYHLRNFAKRLFYNYFLRDFTIASVNLILGLALLASGLFFGLTEWAEKTSAGVLASPGTVMLAALPIILGFQLVLSFITYDMGNVPRDPIHRRL